MGGRTNAGLGPTTILCMQKLKNYFHVDILDKCNSTGTLYNHDRLARYSRLVLSSNKWLSFLPEPKLLRTYKPAALSSTEQPHLRRLPNSISHDGKKSGRSLEQWCIQAQQYCSSKGGEGLPPLQQQGQDRHCVWCWRRYWSCSCSSSG